VSVLELEAVESDLFLRFHSMPNSKVRAALFARWLKVREELSLIYYGD